ncbi:MAG: hypothetical protein Q9Q13_13215 [Acidobacteriota bacterium]|nr:hypothetical protein [Acidobacteriota bacterium]
MRKPITLVLFLLAGIVAGGAPARAQSFGKNKVNYESHEWKIYRSPHYDVHYYFDDDLLLEEIVSEAESGYVELSQRLDHEIRQRIPMVLYATHAAFQRTNIQPTELPPGVGAFAEPFMFRLVLPVDTPPDQRYKVMRHEIVHIFQFDILFGGSLQRTVRGFPPLWFMEGMASYLADDEDTMDQMVIRDAVVNNLLPSIDEMSRYGFLTYRYGHAVFDFIEQEWGDEGLRSLLFEVKKALLANNVDKALRDAFGIDVQTFDRRFARYLRRRYLPILTRKRSPDEYGKEIGLRRPERFTFSPALSPSGDLVAAIGTPGLEADLLIFSAKDGKLIRNLTRGFTTRWDYLSADIFQGKREVSWSPPRRRGGRLRGQGRPPCPADLRPPHRTAPRADPVQGDRRHRLAGLLTGRAVDRLLRQSGRPVGHLPLQPGNRGHRKPHPRSLRRFQPHLVGGRQAGALQPPDRRLREDLRGRGRRPRKEDPAHGRSGLRPATDFFRRWQVRLLLVGPGVPTASSTFTGWNWRRPGSSG